MKKEKILLIIGVILALGVGFLARGMLLSPIIDEAQIRAEAREQVKREIEAKVLERYEATLSPVEIERRKHEKTVGVMGVVGEVFEVDKNEREIKIRVMNDLTQYRGESFFEFLKQPHYFEKRVIILPDSIFLAFREPDFTFQDLKIGMRVTIGVDELFIIGKEEILTTRRVHIFPIWE